MSDETRRFSPFDDDDDDRTQVQPDHPDDATVAVPRGEDIGETKPLPPVDKPEDRRAEQDVWAARAQVRRPTREDWATDAWDDGAPPPPGVPGRKWWLPIVLGIVALILLAAFGYGIYLIANAQSGDTDPTPSAPPATTTRAPETTEPTTTAPTTTPPTTEPTTTEPEEPAEVTVPALIGLSQEEAQQALQRRGLTFRVIRRDGGDAPPGTVIDSDPAEGQEVPPNTQVTLVIAAERTSPPVTPSTPS